MITKRTSYTASRRHYHCEYTRCGHACFSDSHLAVDSLYSGGVVNYGVYPNRPTYLCSCFRCYCPRAPNGTYSAMTVQNVERRLFLFSFSFSQILDRALCRAFKVQRKFVSLTGYAFTPCVGSFTSLDTR